jgi:predicted transcriptional regulator
MTANKLEILMAIARLKPASINQLAKLINREYPHVLKDCRSLEVLGFIKLEEVGAARTQLAPMLIFDYDIIHVKSQIEEIFPITEQSNRVLLTAQVG